MLALTWLDSELVPTCTSQLGSKVANSWIVVVSPRDDPRHVMYAYKCPSPSAPEKPRSLKRVASSEPPGSLSSAAEILEMRPSGTARGLSSSDGVPANWLAALLRCYFAEPPFVPNFIARSTSVRTATPVAPFAFHGFTSSCQAVPAMSR